VLLAFFIIISMLMNCSEGYCHQCTGGLSLLGFKASENPKDFQCCDDDNQLHGYNHSQIAEVLHRSNITLPPRHYHNPGESRSATGPSKLLIEELLEKLFGSDQTKEMNCCDSIESILYPVSGISATTNERVAVLQIEPFKQPVVFSICAVGECRILRGNCSQVYLPQQLYVIKSNKDGQAFVDRDFVLVESGCQCLPSSATLTSAVTSTLGVDEAVKASLLMATGIDIENDYLALLASTTHRVNPSPPPTALTSNSPIDLSHEIDKVTNAPFIGSADDWVTNSNPSTTTSTGTPTTLQSSHASIDETNQVSTVTFHGSTQTPLASTESDVMESETESIPLLKDLPDKAGSPVYIPKGYFDPVLQAIRPFLPKV